MKYTVLWGRSAENSLTRIWLNATDRSVITDAANELDKTLRTAPEEVGESRETDRRLLLAPPLGIKFRVLKNDRIVQVLDVWRFNTHDES